jgi:hypothetical protein
VSATLIDLLAALSPDGMAPTPRPELESDEATWFENAVGSRLITFGPCDPLCDRRRRSGFTGRDEFLTAAGGRRHLYSLPAARPTLNREYVPHIAAYAYAAEHAGFDPARSSFSRYRTFQRDALTKRVGTSYETDAEFYAPDGSIALHVEAKARPDQVARIVTQLDREGDLTDLPFDVVKEIEYVMELRPAFLWVVGPGSIDPPAHVYAVVGEGTAIGFRRIDGLPAP